MTYIEVEVAVLADSLRRAASIAPKSSRGDAFDKSAGILMRVDPDGEVQLIIQATDLEVYYLEALPVTKAAGVAKTWRVPSFQFDRFVSSLPVSSGSTLSLEDEQTDRRLTLKYRKSVLRINTIPPEDFPQWEAFDTSNLTSVSGLGGRIKQVAWASAKGEVDWGGITIAQDCVFATDRTVLARAKIDTGVDKPIVMFGEQVARLLGDESDAMIGFDGFKIQLAPNDYTQIESVVIDRPARSLDRQLDTPLNDQREIEFTKDYVAGMLERSLVVAAQGTRVMPRVRVFIGEKTMAVYMDNEDTGMVGDVADVKGADHDFVEFVVNPINLKNAVQSVPGNLVKMWYSVTDYNILVRLGDGASYICAVASVPKDQVNG